VQNTASIEEIRFNVGTMQAFVSAFLECTVAGHVMLNALEVHVHLQYFVHQPLHLQQLYMQHV
jgi:hypothetical protein